MRTRCLPLLAPVLGALVLGGCYDPTRATPFADENAGVMLDDSTSGAAESSETSSAASLESSSSEAGVGDSESSDASSDAGSGEPGESSSSDDTGGSTGLPASVCGDGIVEDPEQCDDGEENAECDSDCTLPSCGDGLVNESLGEECDDGNNVSGDDYPGSCVIPSMCDLGFDPSLGWPFYVCAADASSAWLSAEGQSGGGIFHPAAICNALGYDGVGEWGETCGGTCGYCDLTATCGGGGEAFFDQGPWTGVGNCGADELGEMICDTVMWTCV